MQLLNQIENAQQGRDSVRGDVGHLIPMYSRPEALDTAYVGVATEQGLFPFDINRDSTVAQDAKTQCYQEPVEVTVTLDDVYLDDERIGARLRYDGSSFDPAAENVGQIELVHRMGRSGNFVLTSNDARRGGLDFRAHGQTFVNTLYKATQKPDAKQRVSKLLSFLDVVYGDAIAVDYENLDFEAQGTGERPAKVRFLDRQIQKTFAKHARTDSGNENSGNESSGDESSGDESSGAKKSGVKDAGDDAEQPAQAPDDVSPTPADAGASGDMPNKLKFD